MLRLLPVRRFSFSVALLALAALLVIACIPKSTPAQQANEPDEVDAAAIRKAIDRGCKYLLSQQNKDGTWGGHENYPGGATALCVLALLNSGVPADDPQIKKSLDFLKTEYEKPGISSKIYSSALIVMVFCAVDPKAYANVIVNHAKWIAANQVKEGNFSGGWSYDRGNAGGRADNSNSQFAILALHEAERAGVLEVDQLLWRRVKKYWELGQNKNQGAANGSWPYVNATAIANAGPIIGNQPGSGSMTCAGLCSTIIARSKLVDGDANLNGETPQCCQDTADDTVIEQGLKWLSNNISLSYNPWSVPNRGGAGWHYYYLYGLERTGRLSGQRFFYRNGTPVDWYREGCVQLLRDQDPLGSGRWDGERNESDSRIATALALLFLSKGRRPVVIAKAQWGQDDNNEWNNHRNDVANLTSYVETAWKKDFPIGLSWQVVNLERASVEDLLQSPVLFISGSKGMVWAGQRPQLLRDYIDRGGFIFAEACCDGPGAVGFDAGFRKLVRDMFADKPEHQLKMLDAMHPVYRAEIPVAPVVDIWGVDYGCRTCIAYVPPPKGDLKGNLGCWWELDITRQRNMTRGAENMMRSAFAIGLNVLAYATNRELKSKDENLNLRAINDKPDTGNRALVYLAKLRHPGGCDTAPGALPGILRAAEQQLNFRVAVEPRMIDIAGKAIFDYHLVFMHGRNSFTLTPNERKQIREYVERGGTLFADSICSSAAFTESFRAELKQIFPQNALEPIPANDSMLTSKFGGFDLSKVTRRQPRGAADGPLDAAKRVGPPELDGIKLGDRYAVIFSKYDLSCALERHDSLECEGYSRDDAERISLNVLLYSLGK
jgi:hypothetical protein